jgi:hypothetical protein
MTEKAAQVTAQHAVEVVQSFFNGFVEEEMSFLPEVLKSDGVWMTICDESILAILFLDEAEQTRIEHSKKEGWHPFPGFMIANSQLPAGQQASFNVRDPLHFYSSKQTSNVFAFGVSPGSSCTVLDHLHRIVDASGKEFVCKVHLAFILGLEEGEPWSQVMPRLSELLDHSIRIWKEV